MTVNRCWFHGRRRHETQQCSWPGQFVQCGADHLSVHWRGRRGGRHERCHYRRLVSGDACRRLG